MRFFFVLENMDMHVAIEQCFLRSNQHVKNHAHSKGQTKDHAKIGLRTRTLFAGDGSARARVDARALSAVVKKKRERMLRFDVNGQPEHALDVFGRQRAAYGQVNTIPIDVDQMRAQ